MVTHLAQQKSSCLHVHNTCICNLHRYLHVYIHTHTRIYIYIYIYMYTNSLRLNKSSHAYACTIHAYMLNMAKDVTSINIYMHTFTYTHTYIYTYILTVVQVRLDKSPICPYMHNSTYKYPLFESTRAYTSCSFC
jgi:hypothetical protein